MTLKLSERSARMVQSEIRNMSIECDRVGGINMSQGICDLTLPEPARIGAFEAIGDGINHYTRYDGLPELRKALAKKLWDFNQLRYDPEGEIVASAGATGAFYCTCLALLDPGDEVVIFEPYYGYHINTLIAAEAKPLYLRMREPNWDIDFDQLEKLITPRTKALLVNTPANPSGKVFSKDELEKLATIAIKHDLFIFTDEIYEYFSFDGRPHVSPASLPSITDRVITISGYSKTFSITGWRIGYVAAREKWARMIGLINDLVYVCAPAPLQIGVARAIEKLPADYYSSLCRYYYDKREKICAALSAAGLQPFPPQGAYYVLVDVSRVPGQDSKSKAMFILQKAGIATVPGEAFYTGNGGANQVRVCFAKSDELIEQACQKLAKFRC